MQPKSFNLTLLTVLLVFLFHFASWMKHCHDCSDHHSRFPVEFFSW